MTANAWLVMHRKGIIKPKYPTMNQCKAPGHPQYNYHMRIVCPASAQLNEQKFLIDHVDIDKFLNQQQNAGSCEEVHLSMMEPFVTFMVKHHKIPLRAYRCILHPVLPPGAAWMEAVWCTDPKYLPLLNGTNT